MNETIVRLLPALATITQSQLADVLEPIGPHLEKDNWSDLLYGIEELAQNGRAALAEQLIAVCLQVARENKNGWAERAATYFWGHIYHHSGQMKRAIEAYQTVVKSGQTALDEDGRFQASLALSSIGRVYMAQGLIPEAIGAVEQAWALDEQSGWQTAAIGSRLQLANLYLVQEEYARAEMMLKQALAEAQAMHDLFLVALAWLRLATLQTDLNNPGQALEYYRAASDALDGIEEPEDEELHLQAYRDLYLGLGTVHEELDESKEAIEAYSHAARLDYILEDKRNQAIAITWLGTAQLDAVRPQLALRSFNAAERLACLTDYTGWIGTIHFFRASAWQALGHFAEAEAAVHQAIEYHRLTTGEDSPDEVGCLMKLGEIALSKGEFETAVVRYQQALTILNKVGVSQMHRHIYLRLGEVYWHQGEFHQAYPMLRRALEVYESRRQTVTSLWARVDFSPIRDTVYEYLVRTCLALGRGIEAFMAIEEGRMRVFREQLAARLIIHAQIEIFDWSDIASFLCLES